MTIIFFLKALMSWLQTYRWVMEPTRVKVETYLTDTSVGHSFFMLRNAFTHTTCRRTGGKVDRWLEIGGRYGMDTDCPKSRWLAFYGKILSSSGSRKAEKNFFPSTESKKNDPVANNYVTNVNFLKNFSYNVTQRSVVTVSSTWMRNYILVKLEIVF